MYKVMSIWDHAALDKLYSVMVVVNGVAEHLGDKTTGQLLVINQDALVREVPGDFPERGGGLGVHFKHQPGDVRRFRVGLSGRGRGLIFNLWCYLSGGETLDIYPCWLALALLDPLYQADAFAAVQLSQQLDCLIIATIKGFLYLVQGVVDEHTVFLIIPAVAGRQAHTVQHKAIEQFSVGRNVLELRAYNKLPGDAVETELLGFPAVKIVKARVSHGENSFLL